MANKAVGLTGGIGSGKTTIANLFAEHQVTLIDADIIARQAVEPNSLALEKIVEKFSKDVLKVDGSLNRQALRDIVFCDAKARMWLEELLHPQIREMIHANMQSAPGLYCLVIIPLLKSRQDYPLDRILVVDAPEAMQIRRIELRDQVNEVQAKAIIDAQIPRLERLKMADDIIINDGHIETLKHEVKNLHHHYQQIFAQ